MIRESRSNQAKRGGVWCQGRLLATGTTKPRLSVGVGGLGRVAATEKAPLGVAAAGVGPVPSMMKEASFLICPRTLASSPPPPPPFLLPLRFSPPLFHGPCPGPFSGGGGGGGFHIVYFFVNSNHTAVEMPQWV